MAHNLVDRCAYRFRKWWYPWRIGVIKGRWNAIEVIDNETVTNLIELFGRYPGSYVRADHV